MKKNKECVGNLPSIVRNDEGYYLGDLRYYFKILFDKAKNLNNPYHNFRHITHFLWLGFDAIRFYLNDPQIGSLRQRRNFLIASIFHDFDHIGKAGPDIINIERAVKAFKKYCHPDDIDYQDEIEKLIRLSEYPHKFSADEISLHAQIMRDVDLTQFISSAWIQQVIFGLAAEQGKQPIEVLKSQETFCNNLKFSTEWAKQKFTKDVLEGKIQEIRELVEILE